MPKTLAQLNATLHALDGRGYRDYRDIQGRYSAPGFDLLMDHVQGDPFAPASRVRALVPAETAAFPPELWQDPVRRTALADFLARAFFRSLGPGREVSVYRPSQKVLARSTVIIDRGDIELRFLVNLPARGRRIMGRRAAEILCREVPEKVLGSLTWARADQEAAYAQVETVEDQQALRGALGERGLVAFVADGAVLPRAGGDVDTPLPASARPVPFRSPDSLALSLDTPNSGPIRGMGIPQGVTLIVGGGFHGKSTLLRALEQGVYDHLPGDGRERSVCLAQALKIRSEDGRAVTGVDISPFIGDLPGGQATGSFSTANASGSTSQAASIMEGIEAGARLLLLDEDTSATNFMIRDRRMQGLVAKDKEPITPFLDRVRELYEKEGISTILVMGGCGDYFEAADLVVMMDSFLPAEVTARARELASELPTGRRAEPAGPFQRPGERRFAPSSFDASKGRREVSIRALGTRGLLYGQGEVDLSGLEQLAEEGQTRAVGALIHLLGQRLGPGSGAVAGLRELLAEIESSGLDLLSPRPVGDLALPRLLEAVQALNRMRGLKAGAENKRP